MMDMAARAIIFDDPSSRAGQQMKEKLAALGYQADFGTNEDIIRARRTLLTGARHGLLRGGYGLPMRGELLICATSDTELRIGERNVTEMIVRNGEHTHLTLPVLLYPSDKGAEHEISHDFLAHHPFAAKTPDFDDQHIKNNIHWLEEEAYKLSEQKRGTQVKPSHSFH